jgi:hypothetical protein
MISIPPVVAPNRKTIPIPNAIIAPPKTAPNNGSAVAAGNSEKTFVDNVTITMAYKVDAVNFVPNFIPLKIITGIFISRYKFPVSTGSNLLKITASPVKPPGAR